VSSTKDHTNRKSTKKKEYPQKTEQNNQILSSRKASRQRELQPEKQDSPTDSE
jgi:hypothetical protein